MSSKIGQANVARNKAIALAKTKTAVIFYTVCAEDSKEYGTFKHKAFATKRLNKLTKEYGPYFYIEPREVK